MKTEHVLKKYDLACNSVLFKFVEKYFCDDDIKLKDVDIYFAGGKIDGIVGIFDYFISFSDMLTCLRMKIPEKTFFAWYDHSLECAMENKIYANLENYYLMTKNTL